MPTVQLRDIVTSADRAAVMELRRAPGQDEYLMWGENVLALDLAGQQQSLAQPARRV